MQVAIYARVSTSRQAENDLSIPDQLRQMQDWASLNGHIVVHTYIEPGASATDDKRPEFQKMIADAMLKPAIFDAIIIHSLSRFFRDGIEFGVYERRLKKNKVKVISITQQTSDDANGELVRGILTMFDGYQSREISKHVSRTMIENARQGYFNGSRPPFGYAAVATEQKGSRGRSKKKLAINEPEADVVRLVYDLYLHGLDGRVMGCKEIAKHLTEGGKLMRGKQWRMQKIQNLISDPTYMGEYFFNMRDSKNNVMRPVSEWVKTEVPPIIDAFLFEKVKARRESRSPSQKPPRVVNSPTLLTGLLKCTCGASMTLTTGKNGRYKYYKCTRRQSRGNDSCPSVNLPMAVTDKLILNRLAERVFSKDKIQALIAELSKEVQSSNDSYQSQINEINRQIRLLDERKLRLMDAIESGVLELDEDTQRRAQQLKVAREALMIELASIRLQAEQPDVQPIKPGQADVFGKVLRQKLMSGNMVIAKTYLNSLIKEIVIHENTAHITGSFSALEEALHEIKLGTKSVPRFNLNWCARRDSNS